MLPIDDQSRTGIHIPPPQPGRSLATLRRELSRALPPCALHELCSTSPSTADAPCAQASPRTPCPPSACSPTQRTREKVNPLYPVEDPGRFSNLSSCPPPSVYVAARSPKPLATFQDSLFPNFFLSCLSHTSQSQKLVSSLCAGRSYDRA